MNTQALRAQAGKTAVPFGQSLSILPAHNHSPRSLAVPPWGSCLMGPHPGQAPGQPCASRPSPASWFILPPLTTAVPALSKGDPAHLTPCCLWHHGQPGCGRYQETWGGK